MDPKAQEQNTNDGTPDEIRAEAVRLERVRVDEIQRIGRILKGGILDDEGFVRKLVNDGTPVEQARSIILEELARRSDETTERRSAIEYVGGGDNPDRRVRSMAEALAARFGGPKPSDPAHQFMRMSASDMARHLLEARGVSTRLLSKSQVIARAYTTSSDFPALLQETGNRFLRSGYDSYPGGVRVIARESSVPDFRMKTVAQLGEAPTLLKVNEAGEFTHGAMAESKEAYRVQSYGRIFGLTRQAIVNDDLGAFATVITKFGRGAAEFIAQQLASLLTSNPVMNDGIAVFHADHGNLESSPGPITIAQLGSGFKSMRLQTGLDGETPIDVTPKYLVVPAALESVALQMTAQINANQASNVNPYAARLEVVVDPRLDASSSTAWYLAADPNAFDGIEYSFLDGDGGPVIETKNGWEVDGTEFKVRLDFGCAVLEHRGLYKNAGA